MNMNEVKANIKIKSLDIDSTTLSNILNQVNQFRVNNDKSINSSDNKDKQILANLVGKLGEHYFHVLYPDAIRIDCFNYDYVLNGEKIDVKTKLSAGDIKSFYTCDIPLYQVQNQQTDSYFFFIINKELTKINIIGKITKEQFLNNSTLFKKGHKIERNGFIYRVDTQSIEVGKILELRKE